MTNRLAIWLLAHRSSTRLAFLLQIGCRVMTSVFSLLWTPLLLRSMGQSLNGLFLSFQSIASMGGLSDLGMGGMVNIQTSRLLGQGREEELKKFLAAGRGLFAVMGLLAACVFLSIALPLLRWQHFDELAQAGPLLGLSLIGALAIVFVIFNSYIVNLNYGCGNILWPILPGFLFLQMAMMGHWLLARRGFPLPVQYAPYVVMAILIQLTGWIWLRLSHSHLAKMWPMSLAWRELLALAGKSFWVYLYSLSAGISLAISRLLINAGFGPDQVPVYQYNNRLCELAMFVIISASLASMPKITQWLASSDAGTRDRALSEVQRLNKFQTFIGCLAAVGYLAVNELFIRYWLGKDLDMQAPVLWQVAFAANLAIASAGYVGYDLAARCCEDGIRVGGIGVALSALLNLGLSLLAMKLHSITGIAFAMVIAQTLLTLGLGYYSCRQTGLSWWQLTVKNWLLAVAAVGVGTALRFYIPMTSIGAVAITGAVLLLGAVLLAYALGIRTMEVRDELAILRKIFGKTAG